MVKNMQHKGWDIVKVYCDNCKLEFEIDTKERNLDDDIIEVYFICPHCNKEYISFRTNSITRKIHDELSKELQKYSALLQQGNLKQVNKKWNKIRKLRKQLKKETNKIN